MRPATAAAAAVAAALLLLLTWLFLRGLDAGARPADRALEALERLESTESALRRDILSARAGLLRDYDPLVRDVQLLQITVERLREAVADGASVERLATWLARQEEHLERFKSDNALLRNSLAQFGLLGVRLAAPSDGSPAVPEAGTLASVVLRLTLDTSAASRAEVGRGLDGLATLELPPGTAEPAAALLAHGRLLHELLPTADASLRALLSGPGVPEREAVRAAALAERRASEEAARRYRALLYAASVLLLGLLVHLGWRLRSRVLASRRRAAFERMVADLSTGFISSDPAEIGAHVEGALARIAERVGADRAFLVLTGDPPRTHSWSSAGCIYPSGWPARALSLAARLEPAEDRVFSFAAADLGRSAGERRAFAAAGVQGWIAAARTSENGEITALLGCDFVRPGRVGHAADLGPLRLALDAVANLVERADLEGERARFEARLQRARRLETIGALASGVAHNFNNMLGAVLGYAEMAEAEMASGGRPANALAEIRRAGERGRDLVDQILTLGRRREAARRPVDVAALVEEADSLLRASLPRGVRLAAGGSPGGAVVSGDHAELQQVVVNICNNAAQSMAGGTVALDVEERTVERPRRLGHGEVRPGCYVVISVSDTGRGMDEATMGRIFEPFFTTRPAGNGLGLATARETVLEHGGAIEVRSTPGAGSRFDVWLPSASAAGRSSGTAAPDVPFGRGETLLLVGGDADRLLNDEELLAALGYEPVGYATAREALEAWRSAPGRFDAAVLCRLELAAGFGLAGALGGGAKIPVVLAAASTDGIDAERLAANGIAEVVRWPLTAVELAPALRRCLAAAARAHEAAAAGGLRP